MFNINLIVFIMLVMNPVAMHFQNIFDEIPSVCEYVGKDTERNDQKLEIINKVWSINGKGRNPVDKIHFSPCGNPLPPTLGCSPNSAACLINSKNSRKSLLNIGQYFDYTLDDDGTSMVLRSINGQPCADSANGNYTIIIQFECQPYSKVTPRYLFKDECQLRVEMMHPTCTPTCSTRMNGHLLSFQNLQKLGTLMVREPLNKQFKLSFCKAADGCGAGISACDITDGTNTSIGQVAFQRFVINSETNDLIVKSHIGASKRVRLNVEIKLSCKWNTQGISNLKYVVPLTQGKHFKFSGESSLACVKLPQNCVITDARNSYLMYNLTTLNRKDGNWKLGNVSNGEEIYLNVCGSLQAPSAATTCSAEYSQVCYIDRRRNAINLGSIPLDLHIVGDAVKATFIAGSVCATNPNNTYRSEIEFSCSQYEKGPILQDINGCVYTIKWETPAACPKLFTTSENCVLYDITGNINLNKIHKSVDRTYNLSQTSYLRYNLCGPLNLPCNNNSDAGVCYVKNNREHVVGFTNKQLIRDNTLLSLELVGDNCAYRAKSITRIYFHCNHSAPADGNVEINMIKDNCVFEISIHTPLACSPPVFSKCEVNNNNMFYNLTSLSQYNNYFVRDSNTDIVYIINVCQSVFNTRDSLCPSDSGACMKNLTAKNIKYKYQTVGRTNVNNAPFIENGELVIRYGTGAYCGKGVHHSSTIHFWCHTHEEGPRFLKKDECSHEFFWRTPAACGKLKRILKTRSKDVSCTYTYPDTEQRIDLGSVHKILELKFFNGESYKFSVCEKNYTHCLLNGTECNTVDTRINLKLTNSSGTKVPYLEYHLQDLNFTNAFIYLVCAPLSESHIFTYIDHKNHIIKANLSTYLSCIGNETELSNEQIQVYSSFTINKNVEIKRNDVFQDLSNKQISSNPSSNVNDLVIVKQDQTVVKTDKNDTYSNNKKDLVISKKLLEENNCFIKNDKSEAILFLKNVESFHASSSSGNNYSFMINEPSPDCNGYICKNGYVFISRTNKCPHYQFNKSNSSIKLLFTSYETCSDKGFARSEIWLTCNSLDKMPHVSKESECIIVAMYPLKEICSLLEPKESSASSTGIAIGSSLALLIFTFSAIVLYILFKKRSQIGYSPMDCTASPKVVTKKEKKQMKIYIKDTEV